MLSSTVDLFTLVREAGDPESFQEFQKYKSTIKILLSPKMPFLYKAILEKEYSMLQIVVASGLL